MADDLEPAQPDKFHWERNSVTIDTLAIDNDAWWDLWYLDVCSIRMLLPFPCRPKVLPLLQNACAYPVSQLDDNSGQVIADRQQTLDNIVHQADQVLRKCVSKKIATFKGNYFLNRCQWSWFLFLGSPELSAIAKRANTVRRKVLEGIKCDGLTVSISSNSQQLAIDPNFIAIIETQFELQYHICDSK